MRQQEYLGYSRGGCPPFACLLIVVAVLGLAIGKPAAEEPGAAPGQVLVSRQLMELRGLAIGDLVLLSPSADGSGARPFEIVDSFEPVPDPFRFAARRLEVRLHLPELIELTTDPEDPSDAESVTRINVDLRDPADSEFLSRELARMPGLLALPARRVKSGSDPFVVLERFHTAIAVVTVIGSSAFLLSLMVMRADERRETAGVLRLIGFTRPRILFAGFIEGLLIAVLGAVVGVLVAFAMEAPFNRFFQWRYDTSLVFLRISPGIVGRCILLAVPLGVLAGLVASWTLLRRNILALLRR